MGRVCLAPLVHFEVKKNGNVCFYFNYYRYNIVTEISCQQYHWEFLRTSEPLDNLPCFKDDWKTKIDGNSPVNFVLLTMMKIFQPGGSSGKKYNKILTHFGTWTSSREQQNSVPHELQTLVMVENEELSWLVLTAPRPWTGLCSGQ